MIRSVCIFCGSRPGKNPLYTEQAQELGKLLAANQIQLVYGGGHVGLMGTSADSCLGADGEVIGVIPQSLVDREMAHDGVTKLHITKNMHERKALMADLSDAFIALPGGYGTLDELCEIITWAQLGIHAKPVLLLNTDGFYDGFLKFIETAMQEGFIPAENKRLLQVVQTPQEALEILKR